MELPDIPKDDLIDVMEMTNKIELFIANVLNENELELAMSALMCSAINSVLSQCQTLDEVMFYRNLFVQIIDISIETIQIKNQEPPFSS